MSLRGWAFPAGICMDVEEDEDSIHWEIVSGETFPTDVDAGKFMQLHIFSTDVDDVKLFQVKQFSTEEKKE
jgi:hypothetical protein